MAGQTDRIRSLVELTSGARSGWRMPAQKSPTTEDTSVDADDDMMKKMEMDKVRSLETSDVEHLVSTEGVSFEG